MKIENCNAWAIQVTLPPDAGKGRRWTHNDTITVVAKDVESATAEVRREYPDAKVWAVNHIGSRTILLVVPA
jgi:hypothetical protein